MSALESGEAIERARRALGPTQRRIYERLVRAARLGETCPMNGDLAELIGSPSTTVACGIVAKLEKAGLIIVHRGSNSRVVTIIETGQSTAGEIGEVHWRLREPGAPAKPRNKRPVPRATARQAEPPGRMPEPVDRTPCFFCETRADVGCKHRPADPAAAIVRPPDPPVLLRSYDGNGHNFRRPRQQVPA